MITLNKCSILVTIYIILNTFEYMINIKDIFKIKSEDEFELMANKIFEFQFNNNNIYRSFCDLINKSPSDVTNSKQIPFLPIKFFKSHKVISSNKSIEKIFISSGTTKTNFSKHHITDLKIYESSFENSFKYFFGDIKKYTILGLLPSYLENENSSLIYMINKLILKTNNKNSGFYLNNYDELKGKLISLKNEKVLLFGVTFALLNLVEKFKFQLPNLTDRKSVV